MAATQNTSTPIRVLVAEFLLASASAAKGVAPSMLMEAEAMLSALLTDIAGLPIVQTTVLLSDDSAARLAVSDTKSSKLFDNVRILRSELSPQSLSNLLDSVSPHAAFDAVFLIAPECDGVLVSLLKVVQSQRRSLIRSFNLDWQLAEIFADKRQTAAWLQYHGIPTIPTRTINDSTAEAFRVAAQLDQAQNVNRIFVRPSFDPEPVVPANPRSRAPALERTARRLLPPLSDPDAGASMQCVPRQEPRNRRVHWRPPLRVAVKRKQLAFLEGYSSTEFLSDVLGKPTGRLP